MATPPISNPGCGPAKATAYGVCGIIVGWLIRCGLAQLHEKFTFHDEKVHAADADKQLGE